MDKKSVFDNHICVIADELASENEDSFKSYQLKSPDSELVKVIFSKLSPYEQYSICHEEKFCIKDIFPPLFLSGGQRQEEKVKNYGQSRGTEFVLEVLQDQHTLSKGNGILLDGRININTSTNELLFRLPEKYLTPTSKKLHVEPRGYDFFVSLTDKPEEPEQVERLQFENPEDSGIYDEFVTDGKNPHSYSRKETRGQNLFLQPHKIQSRLLARYVGMRVEEFWILCKRLHKAGLRNIRCMSLASQVLLYRGRCRQNHDFENIQIQFHISKQTAWKIFWNCAFKHSSCANLIPKLWSKPDLTMAEKNSAYDSLAKVSPYYQTIASRMKDPADFDRKTIFFIIDGILLGVPYTADLFAQKSCYYSPKKDHYIRYINICNGRGEVILFLPPTPSISPTHGDERATGAFIWLDEEREKHGLPPLTGLSQLLRGSDKWQVTMVGDYGFVHRPARLRDDGIGKE